MPTRTESVHEALLALGAGPAERVQAVVHSACKAGTARLVDDLSHAGERLGLHWRTLALAPAQVVQQASMETVIVYLVTYGKLVAIEQQDVGSFLVRVLERGGISRIVPEPKLLAMLAASTEQGLAASNMPPPTAVSTDSDQSQIRTSDQPPTEGAAKAQTQAQSQGLVPTLRQVDSHPMRSLAASQTGSKHPFARLWAWARLERGDLWLTVVYAVVSGLLSLAVPLAVQALFNTVAFGRLVQPLVVLGLIVVVALAFAALTQAMQDVMVEWLRRRFFLRTAMDVANRLPFVQKRHLKLGSLRAYAHRFLDVAAFEKSMTPVLLDGLQAVLQITVGLVLLGIYHPILLGFDLVLVASVLFITFVLGRHAVRTAVQESARKYAVAGWLLEESDHASLFSSRHGYAYVRERTRADLDTWWRARRAHYRIYFRQLVAMLVVQAFAMGSLLIIGGVLVVDGQLSLGQLVAAELVMTLTVTSLAKLGQLFEKYYDTLAAIDKVGAILDLPERRRQGDIDPLSGGHQPVRLALEDVELALEPGSHRILGPQHASIARQIHLILDHPEDAPANRLFIGDHDAADLSPLALGAAVMLLDGRQIFAGSIRDNITFRAPHVSQSELDQVMETLGLHAMLARAGLELDSTIHQDDPELPAGAVALILVARALVLRPQLVVVDRLLDGLVRGQRQRAERMLLDPSRQWCVVYITATSPQEIATTNTVDAA